MDHVAASAERFLAVTSSEMRSPTILVFDSGIGGLSVCREIARQRPDAHYIYAADTAAFPYGALKDGELGARICEVVCRAARSIATAWRRASARSWSTAC